MNMLASVPEFRKEKGREYELKFILAICVIACLAGAKSYREIAAVAASLPQPLLGKLGAKWDYFRWRYKYPRRTAIWYVLTSVDAEEMDSITCSWILSQARKNKKENGGFTWVIAIDGKVMRGAWTGENDKVTLFSAMLQDSALTVAQVRVPDGTNEITQVEAVVKACGVAEGETVLATLDAAHSNKETGKFLGGKQGWDYLITLKTDKPALYRKAAAKIATVLAGPPHDIMKDDSRGRVKIWSCWMADADGISYPHIAQVACICREIYDRTGRKVSKEIVLQITSSRPEKMSAADMNRHTREHWWIENKGHYVRDTVYREDHNQSWTGNGPHSLAVLHNLAIGLLRMKGAKSIKETVEFIHMDRMAALRYMAT
jgi:predicted transposase YbfD/YdcC